MVWKLSDLCLECVQLNLPHYPEIGSSLPTHYKEVLLDRLACHDRYFPQDVDYISRNLFSSRLKHIQFDRCDQINDKVLHLLGKANATFQSVILKSLINVSDSGVQALTERQTSLVKLHISYMPLLTQKVLTGISSPKLTSFKLRHSHAANKSWCSQSEGNSGIWSGKNCHRTLQNLSKVLQDFFARNPNIKVLKIDTETENIPIIARGLTSSLNELAINFQTVTDEMIEILAENCPNLQRLDINGAKQVGKESLIKLFQSCTHLQQLDLGYCSRVAASPENEALWTLPQSLTQLSLCGLMLHDQVILVECITRLHNIKQLKLCGVPALSDTSLAQIVESIGPKLTSLNVSGVYAQEITDNGLRSVATHCTNLQALHISLLKNITGETLRPIFSNPDRAAKIKCLCINSKMMDESVLDLVMSSCPHLEVLDLSGLVNVTDDMLTSLADHSPSLSKIYLKGCKLVSDASICYLVGKCPITCLGVSGIHAITDKSIFCLASSCPGLEEIYLNGCASVSPVAVQYLQDRCLSRLTVKHNIPNASPNQLMAKNLDTGEFCRADLL